MNDIVGKITVTTIGVANKMKQDKIFADFVQKSFSKFQKGDWGDVCKEDAQMNDNALTNNDRILAVYKNGDDKIYIITEWDRSVTTILFPDEY